MAEAAVEEVPEATEGAEEEGVGVEVEEEGAEVAIEAEDIEALCVWCFTGNIVSLATNVRR